MAARPGGQAESKKAPDPPEKARFGLENGGRGRASLNRPAGVR